MAKKKPCSCLELKFGYSARRIITKLSWGKGNVHCCSKNFLPMSLLYFWETIYILLPLESGVRKAAGLFRGISTQQPPPPLLLINYVHVICYSLEVSEKGSLQLRIRKNYAFAFHPVLDIHTRDQRPFYVVFAD